LNEGTTSARAILFDADANVKITSQREFNPYYPKLGWVEHNPEEK
jgi:glycerol kinase